MNRHRLELGKWGEERGCSYLESNGYKILERNYRCRLGEADIIAKKGDDIIFVEVKTRKNIAYGLPAEAVNFRKQSKYKKIAMWYLQEKGWGERSCRFDVLEIIIQPGKEIIHNHIKNAF